MNLGGIADIPVREARLHVGDDGSTLWLIGLDRGDGMDVTFEFPPSAVDLARLIRDVVNETRGSPKTSP